MTRHLASWTSALVLGALLAPELTRAATLTVNSVADDTQAANGLVTLREAILAAESDGGTDLGETGSGADTIVFAPSLTATGDATIALTTVGDTRFGPAAFAITTEVTIQGSSGGRGITLLRDGAVPKLRHFNVAAGGALTLENLTLKDGLARGGNGGTNLSDDGGGGGGGAGLGGAIYSQGDVVVRASAFVGNSAVGGDGGAGASSIVDNGGGGGGGGLGGNGGTVPAGSGTEFRGDGGGGGGGTFGDGNGPGATAFTRGGGGGGGTLTAGSQGNGDTGGAGGTQNGGRGGNMSAPGEAAGPGGGGGGGGDEGNGGAGGFGGGGGGSGEHDAGGNEVGGAGGFGGGGGGGGEDNHAGAGGFAGGGGGGGDHGSVGSPTQSAAGGFGAGDGGGFGASQSGTAGGGGGGGFGGAIFNHSGTLTLTNSTLSGNSAVGGNGGPAVRAGGSGEGLGGAVFNLNGTVAVENATFASNSAGRGLDVFNLAHESTADVALGDATLLLANTILDSGPEEIANVSNALVGSDPIDAVVDSDGLVLLRGGFENDGGSLDAASTVIADALLGALGDNGGPTPTHAPQFPGSPAIDASASGAASDQRGVARPQGGSFDVGAVEVPRFTGALTPGVLLLTEAAGGSVVNIQGGGDFTLAPRFAFGLGEPFGICAGPGGDVYVTEHASGEVSVITTGGDFTGVAAFATGLSQPINLVCSDTQILVAERGTGEVTDITAGGDFSGASPFAAGLGSVTGLFRDSGGTLWAANQAGRVHDITAGGDFSVAPGFASEGGDLRGVSERAGTRLASSASRGQVLDFTAGGSLAGAPVFATVPTTTEIVDLGPVGLFSMAAGTKVFEISSGGDYTAAPPFAEGIQTGGGFADLALVPGCGDGIVDAGTEECDDGNLLDGDECPSTCMLGCTPAPDPMCNVAASASFTLDERKPGNEKLGANLKKLAAASTQADFGDPVGGDTSVALCLFDGGGALALELRVDRAGDTCGSEPCWTPIKAQGFGYEDALAAADGVTRIDAKSGAAGKGSLLFQGQNDQTRGLVQLPTGAAAALAGETSATLQVRASDGACFSADLDSVQTAAGGLFKAKAR